MSVILASQSPRRKELLARLIPEFNIIPADIDETVQGQRPTDYVMKMAEEKAGFIAKDHPQDLVIASDTIVALGDQILGKPADRKDAFNVLKSLSGGAHMVYTAVVIRQHDQIERVLTKAEVRFFDLTDEEINTYLDTEEYRDKAGSYGIQGAASLFVKEIHGDYYAIVGFPVGVVNQMLKKFK